jgi:flavin reductase (DIM6/NTAB) family NADH-FMN oxidoreductase RutF
VVRFDLEQLGIPEAYALITRVVAPRPIAFVSTLNSEGYGNLAPFSYFMMGGSNPPSCIFCPINNRQGDHKDTLRNIEQTGEYVINICVRSMAEQVNQTSFTYPYGVDEFDRAGLTRVRSERVKPPRVGESPVHLECKLHRVLHHGSGALASNYVVGEILLVHVAEELLTDGMPDNGKLDHIARLGQDYYAHITPGALFELPRPTEP